MKLREILPIIKRTTAPEMSRMDAFRAFEKAEPLISLDWHSFKKAWPLVHPTTPEVASSPAYFLECAKCYGKGEIPAFRHVRSGTCFECSGRGKHKIPRKTFDEYKNHEDPRVRSVVSRSLR